MAFLMYKPWLTLGFFFNLTMTPELPSLRTCSMSLLMTAIDQTIGLCSLMKINLERQSIGRGRAYFVLIIGIHRNTESFFLRFCFYLIHLILT